MADPSMEVRYVREDGTLTYDGLALLQSFGGGGPVVVPDGVYGEITVTGLSWTVNAGAIALDELSDVVLTAPANGQVLTFDGASWVNQAPAAPAASSEIYGVLRAPYVLTSTTARQRLFNWSANGAVTLETGVYSFEIGFVITGMSATSGNAAFGILGAGTATLATYRVVGVTGEGGPITGHANFYTSSIPNDTGQIAVANTSTQLTASLFGTFDVTASGTLIPSISLTTAAAASVSAGSFFFCRKIGETGVATRGTWS